jgi:hypothetical protein
VAVDLMDLGDWVFGLLFTSSAVFLSAKESGCSKASEIVGPTAKLAATVSVDSCRFFPADPRRPGRVTVRLPVLRRPWDLYVSAHLRRAIYDCFTSCARIFSTGPETTGNNRHQSDNRNTRTDRQTRRHGGPRTRGYLEKSQVSALYQPLSSCRTITMRWIWLVPS